MSDPTVSDLVVALGRVPRPGDTPVVLLVEEMAEYDREGKPVVGLELLLEELRDEPATFRVRLGGRRPSEPTTRDDACRRACEYVLADGGGRRRRAVIECLYGDGRWHGWDTVDTRTAWNRRRARSLAAAVTP